MNGSLMRRLRVWGDTINVRPKLREICNEAAAEIERLKIKCGEPVTDEDRIVI